MKLLSVVLEIKVWSAVLFLFLLQEFGYQAMLTNNKPYLGLFIKNLNYAN